MKRGANTPFLGVGSGKCSILQFSTATDARQGPFHRVASILDVDLCPLRSLANSPYQRHPRLAYPNSRVLHCRVRVLPLNCPFTY